MSITPYASVTQYEARFGEVSDTSVLEECLEDCTAVINAELDRRGISYVNPSADFADRLMRVCRSMANRVMPGQTADIPVGATQASFTAGPYNEQFTLATTYGTPKMLPSEMDLLGIGGARIGFGALAGRDAS